MQAPCTQGPTWVQAAHPDRALQVTWGAGLGRGCEGLGPPVRVPGVCCQAWVGQTPASLAQGSRSQGGGGRKAEPSPQQHPVGVSCPET